MGVTSTHRWPWYFDQADVGGLIPAIPYTVTQQRIAPGIVRWDAATAVAGDQVILSDTEGNVVWRSQPATGAAFLDDAKFPDTVHWKGLVISQLPHGVIAFYFR